LTIQVEPFGQLSNVSIESSQSLWNAQNKGF
jgi:hypothetical protein